MHVERIPIRWGDMDAMGHVNNTVYFRYMEQARIGWFDALLPGSEAWKATGIVIANASCNFKRPINYPGTVEVQRVRRAAPGGSSVPTFYELQIGRRALRRRRSDGGVHRHGEAEADAHSAEHPRGTPMKKVYPDAAAALKGLLRDDMTIAAGGFGLCGIPENLIARAGATAASRASPSSATTPASTISAWACCSRPAR